MKKNRIPFIKKVSKDIILNICASIVSTGMLQIVVYPKLAVLLGVENYGAMLTAVAYMNVITMAFGNNLFYVKLISQQKYSTYHYCGDFQILVLLSSFLGGSMIWIFAVSLRMDCGQIIGIISATVVTILYSYYIVTFQIQIDYVKNLAANIVVSLGYAVGVFLFAPHFSWTCVFLSSSCAGLLYIFFHSNIIREPITKTPLFFGTLHSYMTLVVSGIIGNAATYLDRFMVYPILGGDSVSVYTTASFFSKSVNLVSGPLFGVILTYLTNKKIVITKKRFVAINAGLFVAVLVLTFICSTIGSFITGIIYPSLIDESREYVAISSFGVLIGAAAGFQNMVILAYAPMRWQAIIPAVRLLFYLITGVVLIHFYGIWGLCISVIVTNSIMAAFCYMIGYRYVSERSRKV